MLHFPCRYPGNKRKEVKHLEEHIDFTGIKTIIEPFCGTSAMSYFLSKKLTGVKYILNDIDKDLIKIYDLLKTVNSEEIIYQINLIKDRIKCKEDFNEIAKEYKEDNCVYKYIYLTKSSFFGTRNLYSTTRKMSPLPFKFNKEQLEFIKFVKSENVIIKNLDWKEIYDQYKDDKESLILMDPPYLMSFNDFYIKNVGFQNVYEYFSKSPDFSCDIYFIVELNWIIKLLFKNCKIIEYNKHYEMSHKYVTHALIYLKK